MDTLFRKYQWVLRLAAIAAAVTLVAIIVNHVVASQLAPLTVPKLPGYKVAGGGADDGGGGDTSTTDPTAWANQLTSRCYFGCADTEADKRTCPDGCDEGEECKKGICVPTETKNGPKSDVPVESDLNVKLLGCMVANNPDYSLAMIQSGDSQQTYVVSPGDFLPEDSEVVRIKRDRIFIRRDGQLEFIRLEKTIGGDPSPTSVSTRGLSNSPNLQVGGGGGGGIASAAGSSDLVRESSGDKVVLSKQALEEATKNPEDLAQDARVISNFQNGERNGLKLVGVAPSGIYAKLGFQTGDVLQSVDGQKLRSQSDAQTFIDRLREGDSFDVVVERDGEQVERRFAVQE